jgi:hypothetical protein
MCKRRHITGHAKAGEERLMLCREVCASLLPPRLTHAVASRKDVSAGSLRYADRSAYELKGLRQSTQNALTDTSDTVYFVLFDSVGEQTMNDAMIAAQGQEESSTDAHDFVEMGKVTEETKGSLGGNFFDGGSGKWNV